MLMLSCTGTTINQDTFAGVVAGYGQKSQTNLNTTVVQGATVTGTIASAGTPFVFVNSGQLKVYWDNTSLAPGSYTVQVSGVGGGTGEALIEIYEVP